MPIFLLSVGQTGAIGPATIAGVVVQPVSELLVGLVFVNALVQGASAILRTWLFVSDLHTGAMSGGSGVQSVLMTACTQMGQFYNLPTGIAAVMTDSKLPDTQSGYQKGYTVALAAHSRANLIHEVAVMHTIILGYCPESYIIDNDMLGAINRTVRGIEVDQETLAYDTIKQVCIEGPSHYLGYEHTLSRMQSDYLYPEVGDRENINHWMDQGFTDIVERSRNLKEKIHNSHFPNHISKEIDSLIRK